MGSEYNVETDILNVNDRRLEDLKNNYNIFKKQMVNLDNQNNLVSSVNKFNDKKMMSTTQQLSALEKDLGTVRRQAEISQNSNLKKEDWIDFLRALFGILAVCTLITMFLKDNQFYAYFVGIFGSLGLFYLLKLLYGFYNRDPNRWNVSRWNTKTYSMIDEIKAEEIDECLGDLDADENEADTANRNNILTNIIKIRNSNEQIDNAQKASQDRIKVLNDRKKQIAELIKTRNELIAEKQKK
jgi:hypothetical protein